MQKSLLDEIYANIGCLYLSDLKVLVGTTKFADCIEEIPWGVYSLSDWNKCICYLTSGNDSFSTEDDARKFLQQQKSAEQQ